MRNVEVRNLAADYRTGADVRLKLTKARVTFPASEKLRASGQNLNFQILIADGGSTGTFVPLTEPKAISYTNATSVTFRIPKWLDDFYAASSAAQIFAIALYNPFDISAVAVTLSCNIHSWFVMSKDVPSNF